MYFVQGTVNAALYKLVPKLRVYYRKQLWDSDMSPHISSASSVSVHNKH